MPKCTKSKDREYVYLPSLEMCRVASEKCRVLYDTDFFPHNLKCTNRIFPCKNCNNDVREMKFNAIGQCMSPLVPTDSSKNHYPGKFECSIAPSYSILTSKICSIQQISKGVVFSVRIQCTRTKSTTLCIRLYFGEQSLALFPICL